MKFYESHYEEYINSVEKYNMHPELIETYAKFPKRISVSPLVKNSPAHVCGSGFHLPVHDVGRFVNGH